MSEGFFCNEEEPELSFLTIDIGFFEEPGCLSISSIISMYNLLP